MSPEVQALRQAIADSGLSSSAYAREVLVRDPRTVRRWLAGHAPIPKSVLAYLGLVEKPGADPGPEAGTASQVAEPHGV